MTTIFANPDNDGRRGDYRLRKRPLAGLGALLLFYYTRARDRSPCAKMHGPPARFSGAHSTGALPPRVECVAVVVWRKCDDALGVVSRIVEDASALSLDDALVARLF